MKQLINLSNYFVDEAGDLTLFNKNGKIIVGAEGVSKTFIVGVASVPDPQQVKTELKLLREGLLADPYFAGVPSIQQSAGKTAKFFHAKDDLSEVRREVFKILPTFNAKIFVAFIRKAELAENAQKLFFTLRKKINPNDVYDELIKRLFRNLLHKSDSNFIYFALRGKSARSEALLSAIAKAKRNFEYATDIKSDKSVVINSAFPHEIPGLQVIDYYLWAIQRLIERGEDRFFNLLQNDYRIVMDLDDKRNKPYGEWYSDSNPLSLKKIKPV